MSKSITLCADDYAQNSEVSKGIIELIKKKRLSATSCLTTSYYWQKNGSWLKPYHGQCKFGLHLNFSEGLALAPIKRLTHGRALPSLNKLLLLNLTHRLDQKAIEDEIGRQLDAFEEVVGTIPDFIDGHQHVHHFPVIRKALQNIYQQRFGSDQVFIRSVANLRATKYCQFKALIIKYSGAKALGLWLSQNNIPHNQSFAGIYPFAKAQSFPDFFQSFLEQIGDQGLIMCHPGLASDKSDPLYQSRQLELDYFLSEQFDRHLAENKIILL